MKELSPKSSQFKVLIYLAFEGPSSPTQIAEDTGISPGTVRPALRALFSKKYVTQERDRSYKSKVPFTDIVSDLFTNVIRRD
ncbi:helix-turn-helix domain-containing protein [Candidatus Bathyarchaeota archaeon]|nr:helix-turn-helix domain-containing protein [Candidatus Bathyarchaeota archaeon]